MEGPPAYSTLEVAKHASAEDAWLIIGGKVLNISPWLNEHPGGDVVLLDLVGKFPSRHSDVRDPVFEFSVTSEPIVRN